MISQPRRSLILRNSGLASFPLVALLCCSPALARMQPLYPGGLPDFNLPFPASSTSTPFSSLPESHPVHTSTDDSALQKGRAPRVTRACAVCRRRKCVSSRPPRFSDFVSMAYDCPRHRRVRCDGAGPLDEGDGEALRPCSLCVQQGLTCAYEVRRFSLFLSRVRTAKNTPTAIP